MEIKHPLLGGLYQWYDEEQEIIVPKRVENGIVVLERWLLTNYHLKYEIDLTIDFLRDMVCICQPYDEIEIGLTEFALYARYIGEESGEW